MNEIKVTEMTEATQINDNDLLMIVQNEKSKKVKLSTIKNQEYSTECQCYNTPVPSARLSEHTSSTLHLHFLHAWMSGTYKRYPEGQNC